MSGIVSFLCTLIFLIIRWILLLVLMPGNEVVDVPEGSEAVTIVRAQHVTILGLFSLAAYKYKSWKKASSKSAEDAPIAPVENQA